MRLCRGMKSQDGTRSSENSSDISRTFFGIFLGLQRILRPFQGLLIFWVLQHFHASQKDPSKVMKRRRIWRKKSLLLGKMVSRLLVRISAFYMWTLVEISVDNQLYTFNTSALRQQHDSTKLHDNLRPSCKYYAKRT